MDEISESIEELGIKRDKYVYVVETVALNDNYVKRWHLRTDHK